MEKLRIRLFGEFRVSLAENTLPGFEARKVQELFSYLLLHAKDRHHREILTDLLWRDASAERGRRYLRKTLWQLQSALMPYCETNNGQLMDVDADWIQIDPARCWVDVLEFSDVFSEVQDVSGELLKPATADRIKEATELHQGGLLAGWYQEWCLFEREWLERKYLMLLDKLVDYHQSRAEYELGLNYVSTLLRYDQTRERSHRRLMRLYYLNGDRSAALRQYERLTSILEKELGVEPTYRTQLLYEQIRSEQFGESPRMDSHDPSLDLRAWPGGNQPFAGEADTSSGHLSHLELLDSLLLRAHSLVRSEMDQIKGNQAL